MSIIQYLLPLPPLLYIQMAVAAAIGVGSGDAPPAAAAPAAAAGSAPAAPAAAAAAVPPMHHGSLANRINNKMRAESSSAAIVDINSSIEKMSLDGSAGAGAGGGAGGGAARNRRQQHLLAGKTQLTQLHPTNLQQQQHLRRDSGWTNSTEGYGSMRSSEHSSSSSAAAAPAGAAGAAAANAAANSSRRCSEVSAMSHASNFSTMAMRNSPWCPGDAAGGTVSISACSSRRSSMMSSLQQQDAPAAAATTKAGVSQHLSRLHHKAQQGSMAMQVDGRQSVMSDCSIPSTMSYQQPQQQQQQQQQQHYNNNSNAPGVRRASDPVRTLDRNFGVGNGSGSGGGGGGLSRHRSYTQLNNLQQQRVPLHGQQVRGMQQQQVQQMHQQVGRTIKKLQNGLFSYSVLLFFVGFVFPA